MRARKQIASPGQQERLSKAEGGAAVVRWMEALMRRWTGKWDGRGADIQDSDGETEQSDGRKEAGERKQLEVNAQ